MEPERNESPSILSIPPPAEFQNITAGQNAIGGSAVSSQTGVSLPAGQAPLAPMGSIGSTVSTVSTNSINGVSTVSTVSGNPSNANPNLLDSVVSTVSTIPSSMLGGSSNSLSSSILAGKEGVGEEASIRKESFPSSTAAGSASVSASSSLAGVGTGVGGGENGKKEEGNEWKELMGNVGNERKRVKGRWIQGCLRAL